MNFSADYLYHIYNRGNYKQKIAFNQRNYLYFISKVKKYIVPFCELLSYCVMPNHFHLLIYADERSELQLPKYPITSGNLLSEGLRMLLSSYAKGINKQESRSGNLFQQHTKSKLLTGSHPLTCFHYMHQNPLKAKIVEKMEAWPFSSFNEYARQEKGICNQELAYSLLDMSKERFYEDSYQAIPAQELKEIFL